MRGEDFLPKPKLDLPLPEKELSARSAGGPAGRQEIPTHSGPASQGLALRSYFSRVSRLPLILLIPLILFILFVIAFLIGGFMIGKDKTKDSPLNSNITPTAFPTAEPTPTCIPRPMCLDQNPRCLMPEDLNICPPNPSPREEAIFCAQDARQCPDGTWVGRTGKYCEFICPK